MHSLVFLCLCKQHILSPLSLFGGMSRDDFLAQ